jgi:hypothetical protein
MARRYRLPHPATLGNGQIESGLTTERLFMSDNNGAACDLDTALENFAAELTCAVYPIALRHGMAGSWINVELSLWRALAETVKKWAPERPSIGPPDDFEVWRQGFLVDLTEGAFYIAVKHGVKGSFLEVELDLYRTFRLMVRRREDKGTQDAARFSLTGREG